MIALIGTLLMSFMALTGCAGGDSRTADRRHVLLLSIDTLRPDYLGAYGYPLPTSPVIDSLLATGTTFTRAVTPIPRTTQALGSMLTGCYPHTHMIRFLFDSLSTDMVTLAELAQRKGYRTVAVVSNHVLPPKRRLDRGFDIYDFADDAREAAQTTQAVIDHLASAASEDSLLVWVHYIDPHVPYYPPLALARTFDPGYEGRYRDYFGGERGGIGDKAYPEDIGKIGAVFENRLPEQVNEHIRRLYAADIRATDDAIGTLLRWLRRHLGDDWVIIFTSDHGESLGEHDYYYDHGDYVYNASLRIPLGFIFPENDPLTGNGTCDEWVSLVDIMPTLVDLLGLRPPPDLPYTIEGRSLLPLLEGGSLQPAAQFAECGRNYFPQYIARRTHFNIAGRFRSVILGEWKLIWTPGSAGGGYELYNIASDPHETKNLVTLHSEIAAELARIVIGWTRSAGQDGDGTISEDDLERLRSLGYIQ